MSVKGSGTPLSMSEVAAEFGDSPPYSFSEFYRGGSLVPTGPTQNNGIALSGNPLSMNGFYGSIRAFVFNKVISVNTPDYRLYDDLIANGWVEGVPVIVTITVNYGVVVYESVIGNWAMIIAGTSSNGAFVAGSSVHLINNGIIIGHGGNGGDGGGGYSSGAGDGFAGSNGGNALLTYTPLSITNNNAIYAGGGGGGGGAGGNIYYTGWGGGGGGGGGAGSGLGGIGGSYNAYGAYQYGVGQNGGLASLTSPGAGGAGYTATHVYAGAGGAGGLGTAGSPGGNFSGTYGLRYGGAGGQPGYYIGGNSLVTWNVNGTRAGNIQA